MLPLSAGEVTQYLGADGIGVTIGQGFVGVVALHFGLPISFEGGQNLLQLGTAECGGSHGASPCVLLRIRHLTENSQ